MKFNNSWYYGLKVYVNICIAKNNYVLSRFQIRIISNITSCVFKITWWSLGAFLAMYMNPYLYYDYMKQFSKVYIDIEIHICVCMS
jgi:hypothetical protein